MNKENFAAALENSDDRIFTPEEQEIWDWVTDVKEKLAAVAADNMETGGDFGFDEYLKLAERYRIELAEYVEDQDKDVAVDLDVLEKELDSYALYHALINSTPRDSAEYFDRSDYPVVDFYKKVAEEQGIEVAKSE